MYYEVIDSTGKLRFQSLSRIDCEYFVKKLLKSLRSDEKRPTIREVKR